jgi:hypothetical protein
MFARVIVLCSTAGAVGALALHTTHDPRWLLVCVLAVTIPLKWWVSQLPGGIYSKQLAREVVEARSLVARGKSAEALQAAAAVVRRARTTAQKEAALTVAAWAFLAQGRPERARQILRAIALENVDLYCLAAVEDALGNSERAAQLLERGRKAGTKTSESVKLLIDLHARRGDLARAAAIAAEEIDLLGPTDCRAVLEAAMKANETRSAADLAAAIDRRMHALGAAARRPLEGTS